MILRPCFLAKYLALVGARVYNPGRNMTMPTPSLFFRLLLFIPIAVGLTFGQQTDRDLYTKNYKNGEFKKAFTGASNAVKKDRSDWYANYYAGLSLMRLGQDKNATKFFQKAAELRSDDANIRAALAYNYLVRNDKRSSSEADAALKLDNKNAQANLVLSVLSFRLESFQSAYDHADAVIKASPEIAVAYYIRAHSLIGSFAKQLATINRAAKSGPSF